MDNLSLLGTSIKYIRSKRRGAKAKAYIYCFYDVILLFESVQVNCKGEVLSENYQI